MVYFLFLFSSVSIITKICLYFVVQRKIHERAVNDMVNAVRLGNVNM